MEYTFNLRQNPNIYQTIICRTEGSITTSVILAPLSQDNEKLLDIRVPIKFTIDKKDFRVEPKNVYFYGEVDFSDDSDDLDEIDEKATWFDKAQYGVHIPLYYDYETHTCKSDNEKYYKTRETFIPSLVVQYLHGLLGKPKKIIIFKDVRYTAKQN